MNYRELQLQEVRRWRVYVLPKSDCWSRTHAHCDGSRRICKHSLVNSYRSLVTLLHEIGHIETDIRGMKRCEQESEAVRWQVNRLRELNLPVKRKLLNRYKDYVQRTYQRGIRRGLKKRITSKLFM